MFTPFGKVTVIRITIMSPSVLEINGEYPYPALGSALFSEKNEFDLRIFVTILMRLVLHITNNYMD